jgi:D-glycero-D-manno-heptose 1,7-bisphosphate phosphatase
VPQRPQTVEPLEFGRLPQITADGCWCEVIGNAGNDTLRPCLFLDRDGVIVEEVGYLHRVEDLRLIEAAVPAIAAANARDWRVVIVTNQAGIGRGLYGWEDFHRVQSSLLAELAARGAGVDMVLACPHHASAREPYRHPGHPWRKPNPGMLMEAARRLSIDLGRSWIVGDHFSDLEAGRAAGLAGGVHVLTGHGRQHRETVASLATTDFAVLCAATAAEALSILAP